jgi:hypothetical protein
MERQDGSPLRLRFESDEALPLDRMLPTDQDSVFMREAPPLPKAMLPRAPPKRCDLVGAAAPEQAKKRVRKKQHLAAGEGRAPKRSNTGHSDGMPGVAGWKLGTGPQSGIGDLKVSQERSKLARKLQQRLHHHHDMAQQPPPPQVPPAASAPVERPPLAQSHASAAQGGVGAVGHLMQGAATDVFVQTIVPVPGHKRVPVLQGK